MDKTWGRPWGSYYYTAFHLISILCFFKDGIDKNHSSGIYFRKKLNHSIENVLAISRNRGFIMTWL